MATGGKCRHSQSTQKGHNLICAERPVEFRSGIDPTQYWNSQAVSLIPGFIFSNIDQFDQQPMLDERHELGFSDLTEMTPERAEQLTFRRHVCATAK